MFFLFHGKEFPRFYLSHIFLKYWKVRIEVVWVCDWGRHETHTEFWWTPLGDWYYLRLKSSEHASLWKMFQDLGHYKWRKQCIIWENYSKAEGEGRASVCGIVKNGPRYRTARLFIRNNQFKIPYIQLLNEMNDCQLTSGRMCANGSFNIFSS